MLVVALAFALRLTAIVRLAGTPTWDGKYYHEGARNIAAGLGYVGDSGKPWCHYPVGYSALLAAAYRLSTPSPMVGLVVNLLLGVGTVWMIYDIARRELGPKRAMIAGLICAVHPGLILTTSILMTETASAFGLTLVAWLGVVRATSKRRIPTWTHGVSVGLSALVRPPTLLMAPAMAVFFRKGRRRVAVWSVLVALAVAVPWTLRNCLVMDGCAFISTNAGWNLAIGAFPRATGRFTELRVGDGCHAVIGQVDQDRCWQRHALGWIAADPNRWLALVPVKLGHTFDHESFPVGYLSQVHPKRWSDGQQAVGRQTLSWWHRLLLVAATLGVATSGAVFSRAGTWLSIACVAALGVGAAMTVGTPFWPLALALCGFGFLRRRELTPSSAFAVIAVASVVLVHAIFFGEDRYHMVLSPLLCMLAASVGSPPCHAQRTADRQLADRQLADRQLADRQLVE